MLLTVMLGFIHELIFIAWFNPHKENMPNPEREVLNQVTLIYVPPQLLPGGR
jgi:hypothetical protein